jgi:hypothetical protein
MIASAMGLQAIRGLRIDNQYAEGVFNRTGAAVEYGDLVMFDLARAQAETTSDTIGAETSVFSNFVVPATVGLLHGLFGIVVEEAGIADNAAGRLLIRGIYDSAYIIMGSGNLARNIPLVAINGSHDLDGVVAAGEKYLAISMDTATTPTTHVRKKVLFDGIYGFGTT